MRLTFKIAVVFLFFSVLLYGFSDQTLSSATNNFVNPSEPHTVAEPIVEIAELASVIKESSGLEEADAPGTFITHNDANNPPELFKIDKKGKLLATLQLNNTDNIDWEDLTKDNKGNIYIGDIGNNNNKRKNLRIYKLNLRNPNQVQAINFEYADRKAGTADKEHFEFDSEALFWYQSKLYLITKDREDGVQAKLYELPDKPGNYEAVLIDKYEVNSPVTAADISPDGKTLLLLSKGKAHLFHPVGGRNFFGSKMQTVNLGKVGQTEAAVFTNNQTIVFTSEEGKMYQLKL